jgi:hypothetical protein
MGVGRIRARPAPVGALSAGPIAPEPRASPHRPVIGGEQLEEPMVAVDQQDVPVAAAFDGDRPDVAPVDSDQRNVTPGAMSSGSPRSVMP